MICYSIKHVQSAMQSWVQNSRFKINTQVHLSPHAAFCWNLWLLGPRCKHVHIHVHVYTCIIVFLGWFSRPQQATWQDRVRVLLLYMYKYINTHTVYIIRYMVLIFTHSWRCWCQFGSCWVEGKSGEGRVMSRDDSHSLQVDSIKHLNLTILQEQYVYMYVLTHSLIRIH